MIGGSIALYLNQQPKDITKGFVFGSDPRSCDVLLAKTRDTGISGNHFSIHIDWVSRDPIITCLSGNAIRIKATGAETTRTILKDKWQRLIPGSTTNVRVTQGLGVTLLSPNRRNQQAAYNRNLQQYTLDFKNAVPELANISLGDTEVTPFILNRCAGLERKQYYPTAMITTGDVDYDSKVFLYDAKCKPLPDAPVTTDKSAEFNVEQSNNLSYSSAYPDVEHWLLDDSTGRQPGELFLVKHYRDKRNQIALPSRFKELRKLDHLNLERFIDLITETSVFMVVTDSFPQTTLEALHQETPLNTGQAAFVLGQIFGALEYLHERQWTHGNLDPRSIHVIVRERLFIQLTDIALSNFVDLGKPEDYHELYASQQFGQKDKSPADIWSAGVVALQLLYSNGLPRRDISQQALWVAKLERLAEVRDQECRNEATAFVRSVLKHEIAQRPTATEVLENPWIVRNRKRPSSSTNQGPNYFSPQESRQSSVGPSNVFNKQNSGAVTTQALHHSSGGPSSGSSRQSSVAPSVISTRRAIRESYEPGGNNYVNFDWVDVKYVEEYTANLLAQGSRAPTPSSDSADDVSSMVAETGHDSGEETETGSRPKKLRKGKGKAVPLPGMELRSHGKGRR